MRAASHISLFHTAGAIRAVGGVHNSIAARRRRRQRLLYGSATSGGGTVGVGERTDMNIEEPNDQIDQHSDLLSDSRSSDEEHVKKRIHSRNRSPSLPLKGEDHCLRDRSSRRTSLEPAMATDLPKQSQRCVRQEHNEEQGDREATMAPAPFDPYKHIFNFYTSSSSSTRAEENVTQANTKDVSPLPPQPCSPYPYPPSRGRVRGLFIIAGATGEREGAEAEAEAAATNNLIDCLCRLKLPLREVCVLAPSTECRDKGREPSHLKGREDGVVTGSDTDVSDDYSVREHETSLSKKIKPSNEQNKEEDARRVQKSGVVPCEGHPGLCAPAPTKANIVAHLRWLAKDSAAGDVLILHLTGGCFLRRDACDARESSSLPDCRFVSSCFATSSAHSDGENTCKEYDSLITGSEILAVLAEEMRASGRGSARLIAVVDCVFAPLSNSDVSRRLVSQHQEQNMHCVLPLPLEFTFREGRKHTYPQEDGGDCHLLPLSDLDIIMYSNSFDSKCDETNVHHHEHKHHHDCTKEEEEWIMRGVEARTCVGRLTQALCQSLLSTTALSYEDLLNEMRSDNAQSSSAVAPLSAGSSGSSTCFALSSSRKIKVTETFSFFGSRSRQQRDKN